MKKTVIAPSVEIIRFRCADVIATSDPYVIQVKEVGPGACRSSERNDIWD